MRLFRVPILLFTVCWLLACHFAVPSAAAASLALVGGAAAMLAIRRSLWLGWPSLGFLSGVLFVSWVGFTEEPSQFARRVGEQRADLLVEARIVEGPREWPHGSTFVAELTRVDRKACRAERVRLYVAPAHVPRLGLVAGDVVEVFGRASRFAPADFPGIDGPRERLERKGLAGALVALEPVVVRARPWSVARLLAERRLALERAVRLAMPRHGAIGVAMLTGSRGGIEEPVDQLFRDTGTVHVLAISGLHFGALAGLLWGIGCWLFRRSARLGARFGARRAAAIFVAAALLAYLGFVGAPVSAVRAWMMLALLVVAVLASSRPSVWGALCAAAIALTLGDPHMTRDLGFQLSFTATGAIALFWYRRPQWLRADPYRFTPESGASRFARNAISFVGVSWSATFATMPILAAQTGTVSVVSPLTNLFVVPLVSIVTFPSLVAGSFLIELVPSVAGLALAVADESLNLAILLLRLVVAAVRPVAVVGSPGAGFTAAMSLAVLAALLAVCRARAFAGAAAVIVGVAFCWMAVGTARPDRVLVHFIPVGQGDAVFVEGPRGRVLVDAGGSRVGRDPGRHVVVPYLHRIGVDSLDALVLTHDDFDHVGGAPAVLERLTVRSVVREPVDLGIDWLRLFRVTARGAQNDRSILAEVVVGPASVLLTGDIEAAAERNGLRTEAFRRSLVLKAPHHGSKTSSTGPFLDRVVPRVAVVSAGRHNRFGHPHRDVVDRYQDRAVQLLSTAENGLVVLAIDLDGNVAVRTARDPSERK